MNKKNLSKNKNRNELCTVTDSEERKAKNRLKNFAKKIFSKNTKKSSTNVSRNVQKTQSKMTTTLSASASAPTANLKTIDLSEKTAKSFRKNKKGKKTPRRKKSQKSRSQTQQQRSTTEDSIDSKEKQPPEFEWEKPIVINAELIEKAFLKMITTHFNIKSSSSSSSQLLSFINDCWSSMEDIENDDSKCQAFIENEEQNQAEDVECLDENRVKLDPLSSSSSSGPSSDYIHASYVKINDVKRKFILTQLPKQPYRENFWAMIYQQNVHNMYILCSSDESIKTGSDRFSEYFPLSEGQHEYYGSIWVHNRKSQMANEAADKPNDVYIVEVLPQGCAESNFVTIHVCSYWPPGLAPTSLKRATTTASNSLGGDDSYEADPICIVSKRGAGRAGTFLALSSSINLLKAGNVPNMKEIVTTIRAQRPSAIDTETQLVFVFFCLFSFVKQYSTANKELNEKLKSDIGILKNYMDSLKTDSVSTVDKTMTTTN